MTTPRPLPHWLTEATSQQKARSTTSNTPLSDALPVPPATPQPLDAGQVRRLDPMDADGAVSRLVLILWIDPVAAAAQVVLLSNEVENSSDTDVLISASSTGLPFDLVALTDVTGPAWYVQFGPVLATVDVTVLDSAHDQPAGIPVQGPNDPRWQWKQDEHDVLMSLIGECARQVIDEGLDAVVDPAAMDLSLVTEVELALMVQATAPLLAQHRVCMPISALKRLSAHPVSPRSRTWDAVRCLLDLVPRRTHLIVREHADDVDMEFMRRPLLREDDLPLALGAAFARQPDAYRSLRLLTLQSLWPEGQREGMGELASAQRLRMVTPGVCELFIAGQRHQLLIQPVERVTVTDAALLRPVGGLVHA